MRHLFRILLLSAFLLPMRALADSRDEADAPGMKVPGLFDASFGISRNPESSAASRFGTLGPQCQIKEVAPGDAPENNVEPAGRPPQLPLWNHNGSTMRLRSDGNTRQFIYEQPRQGMIDAGARAGTILFNGRRDGGNYTGTAYVFSKTCGASGFTATGPVAADDRSVTLYGSAPSLNSRCQVTGYRPQTLEFNFLGD